MLLEERYKEKYDEGFAEGIAKGIAKGVAKGVAETNQHHIKQLFQNGFSVEDVAKLFVDIPADTIQAVWESFKQSQEDNA
jgi:flagellar biosynthesis/type III secretory pathway protein FliH